MFEILILMLQMFADAGTLVNASTNYVNAYSGQTTSFDATHTLAPEMKTFYDTLLLENARVDIKYGQFAKKQSLPANHGRTVEWRRPNTFARAEKLTEAVIPTGQKFGYSSVTASIDQFGTYTSVSDILELHAYDNVIGDATEEMGASLAETQEDLIRKGLYTGTNVLYCDNVKADGTFVNTPTEATKMAVGGNSGNDGYAYLTPDMVNKAATKMKKDKVKQINGKYYAVIHPSVTYDLRSSAEWLDVHKYAQPEEIYNGEIGELHGVRFIEDNFAPVYVGADLASNSRTLSINYQSGYSGAITSVTFDGGTVVSDALIGRVISINGVSAVVTDNTTTTLTFASTNFGSIADNTVIYPGEGAAEGAAAYATYFFGKDAFATIDPENGGAEMIVKPASQVGGPLNQFSTIGYKFESNGATILYPERVLRVMSTSAYSKTDAANI